MNILRMAGVVLIAFSGICGAFFLNRDAKAKLRQAEAFISLVRFLRAQIECFAMSVPRALARVPREILSECGYTDSEPPKSVGELIDKTEGIGDELTAHMRRLAEDIGKGYREEQLTLCDYCLSLLEGERSRLSGQLPMKIKVNSALSLAGAAAVVILLV